MSFSVRMYVIRSILLLHSTSKDIIYKLIKHASFLSCNVKEYGESLKNISNTMKYSKMNPQDVPKQPKTHLVFLLTKSLCSIGKFSTMGVKQATRSSGGALSVQHACVCVRTFVQVRAHLTC
jgi:hypothetical protein